MGFGAATGIIQHIHRNLTKLPTIGNSLDSLPSLPGGEELRRDRPVPPDVNLLQPRPVSAEGRSARWRVWQIYIDNWDQLQIWDCEELEAFLKHLCECGSEQLSDEQRLLRQRYRHFGIPRSESKTESFNLTPQPLGTAVQGVIGRMAVPTQYILDLVHFTFYSLLPEGAL